MSTGDTRQSVSVVIGAYNAADWIGEALDSVVAQTYPILEILVIDDGSTDSTREIAKSHGVVKCLAEEHRGRPHRNRGIMAAKGEYIAFLDADDLWHPMKIEAQMRQLHPRSLSWSICDFRWCDAAGGRATHTKNPTIQEGDILKSLLLENFIAASVPIVARHVFDQVGYFNESADVAGVEDWELWLRIAARFPVGCIREQLATIRLHADSFLAAMSQAQKVQSLEYVVERAVEREPIRLKPLRDQALASVYFAAGVHLLRQGRLGEARTYFVKALRRRPRHVETITYTLLTLLAPRTVRAIVETKRNMSKRLGPPR